MAMVEIVMTKKERNTMMIKGIRTSQGGLVANTTEEEEEEEEEERRTSSALTIKIITHPPPLAIAPSSIRGRHP